MDKKQKFCSTKVPFSLSELRTLSTQQIISGIDYSHRSVLCALGGEEHLESTSTINALAIFFARFIRKYSKKPSNFAEATKNYRKTYCRIVKHLAGYSYSYHGFITEAGNTGLVLAFNHPSLGEVIRLVAYCFEKYPDKKIVMPVDLKWYECFSGEIKTIFEDLGIITTPIITPTLDNLLEEFISKKAEECHFDEATKSDYDSALKRLKICFYREYLDACAKALNLQRIVLVAPSAIRQPTIFPSEAAFLGREKVNPTLISIAIAAKHRHVKNCYFVPVVVIPPRNSTSGLNLLKNYSFHIAEGYNLSAALEYKKNPESFDWTFLKRMCSIAARYVPFEKEICFPTRESTHAP